MFGGLSLSFHLDYDGTRTRSLSESIKILWEYTATIATQEIW